MRTVIQRTGRASVSIGNSKKRTPIAVFVGIEESDSDQDVEWLCNKIVQLRLFNDSEGIMNLSVLDIQGEIMVISQFTLHAKTKKGNRPSYIRAAHTDIAVPLYNRFVSRLSELLGKEVATGEFGAMMEVELVKACNYNY
jgi:D-tyrosyl-tRNA(Tyr) deacylase